MTKQMVANKGISAVSSLVLSLALVFVFCAGDVSAAPGGGNTYVFNGWAGDPDRRVTFPDGTVADGNQAGSFQSIGAAVSHAQPGGTVYVANGDGPYSGPDNMEISIDRDLSIIGESREGTTVDAQQAGRIFTIATGKKVEIRNLTFTNGAAVFGGAIFNSGILSVENSAFIDGKADFGGGAIFSVGDLTLKYSILTGNTRGAVFKTGSAGTLEVEGSTFADNTGSAVISSGSTHIGSSVFTNNKADFGGAFYNLDGTADIHSSTIVGNANYDIYCGSGSVDAEGNWWGTGFENADPLAEGRVNTGVSAGNWLLEAVSADLETPVPAAGPVTLVDIAVTAPPAKTVYSVGEVLDLTGLAIEGTYSDGSTAPMDIALAGISGFDSSTAVELQVITVMYEDKTDTFTVEVAAVVPARVAAPAAAPGEGMVPEGTVVTLATATEGAAIYFTTDGSTPDISSSNGTELVISGEAGSTVTVRAFAMKEGMEDSEASTFIYTIEAPEVTDEPDGPPPADVDEQ